MTNVKIAICSKGRGGIRELPQKDGSIARRYNALNIAKMYEMAEEVGFDMLKDVYLFIEPQDVESYVSAYPKWPTETIIVLGGDDQGLAYSRQTALQYFQDAEPTEVICMLDDDTILFKPTYKMHKKKNEMYWANEIQHPYTAIQGIYQYALTEFQDMDKVGMIGCEYNQFLWSKTWKFPADGSKCSRDLDEFSNHGCNDCAVFWFPLLYKEKGIKYDNLPLKCDRDFTAQVAYNGLFHRKIYRFGIDSPLNGSGAGGCKKWYDIEGQESKECEQLVEKWNVAYPKAELTKLKPKKTSYGRSMDVKFFFQRIYHSYVHNLVKTPVVHLFGFEDSINNYHKLSDK